ncbi:MAG: hypothetical protein QM204_00240 [Bacillota bacterium]|jgi:hypothetical protein|nr:hypothetical protein [Bacillota bacterium]NLL26766.1 hypothetical protein [Erysipelotrichia bacterium]
MKKHFIKQFIKIVITLFFSFSLLFTVHYFTKKSRIVKPVTIVPSYEIIEDLGYYKPYRRFLFENINIARAAISLATMDNSNGRDRLWFTRWGLSDLKKYVGIPGYCPETFIKIAPQLTDILYYMDYSKHNTGRWCKTSYCLYASCDFNVALAVWWSGADDNFPAYLGRMGEFDPNFTSGQTGYLIHNYSKDKWIQVQPGSKVLPGDIALGRNEEGYICHIWMYLATWENGRWLDNSLVQEKFPNTKANRYEGSYEHYYAKVGYDENPWLSSAYIFRFTGIIDETSEFKAVR